MRRVIVSFTDNFLPFILFAFGLFFLYSSYDIFKTSKRIRNPEFLKHFAGGLWCLLFSYGFVERSSIALGVVVAPIVLVMVFVFSIILCGFLKDMILGLFQPNSFCTKVKYIIFSSIIISIFYFSIQYAYEQVVRFL